MTSPIAIEAPNPFDGFEPQKIVRQITLDAKVLNVRIDRSTIDMLIRDYVISRTRLALKNPALDRKNVEITIDYLNGNDDTLSAVDVNITVLP